MASEPIEGNPADLEPVEKRAGAVAIASGVVIAIGTFLPWVTAVTTFGFTLNRNAYQFGSHLSMTYDGPLILAGGIAIGLCGLVLLGVIEIRRVTWGWLLTVVCITTGAVAASWLQSWNHNPGVIPGVTFSRGIGGIVALIGCGLGFVSYGALRQGAPALTK